MNQKPLFLPLRREWFDAFANGTKREEWRRYGPRWHETSCRIGRRVVLSLGYTSVRMTGVITGFRVQKATGLAATIYGEGTPCAVIEIRLDPK